MYKVEVEFPPRGAGPETADIVLVMGAPSDVDAACDELINKANDLVSFTNPTFLKYRPMYYVWNFVCAS